MGGGAGVSVHGRYRLADAALAFAMPETGIGFIPDVGASFFLSRCPDEMGMYLGLTGARIGLGDALALGLMTHAVDRRDLDAVIDALAEGEATDRGFCRASAGPAPLAAQSQAHRHAFRRRVGGSDPGAAGPRRQRFRARHRRRRSAAVRPPRSNSSSAVARRRAALNLKQCLKMEFRLAAASLLAHDFREGVRAALIDKDRKPQVATVVAGRRW